MNNHLQGRPSKGHRRRRKATSPKHSRDSVDKLSILDKPKAASSKRSPSQSSTLRDKPKKRKKPSHPKSNFEGPMDNTYAVPSKRPNHPDAAVVQGNKTSSSRIRLPSVPPSKSRDFAAGDDYIAFEISDQTDKLSLLERQRQRKRAPLPEPHIGSKRSADQMEYDEDGYENKKQRLDAAARLTPWVNNVGWDRCRNLAETIHEEVKSFINYISPTPEEHEVRAMIIATIRHAIQRSWPDARVLPFGSYETKLYLPLGDIDLVVQSAEMERHEKKSVLYNLAQLLRHANIADNVSVIAKARVPIIKFVTSYGRFAVDISLNQSNGLEAGTMVNRLLKWMPALRPLVMIIKLFLSQRSMNEVYTGGLGSYAIVCMAVSFLQMHPKIRAGEIDPSCNLGVLIMEFFELYGHHFKYEITGISLRDGGTYFDKCSRGWDDPRNPTLLSIEDPLDTSNDISKNSYNIGRVRKTLAGAHEVLSAAAFMRGRILTAKARGEYTDLGSSIYKEYQNPTILGSVMGVTQQMLNHRRMVKQLYDQGILQNMLGLPLSLPTNTHPTNNNVRALSAKAVHLAWNDTDSCGHSEEAEEGSADMLFSDDDDDDDKDTRYITGNQKAGKRPQLGREVEDTFYVEESEDESDVAPPPALLEKGSRKRAKREDDLKKATERRAYWASKGIPGGGLEDSDY